MGGFGGAARRVGRRGGWGGAGEGGRGGRAGARDAEAGAPATHRVSACWRCAQLARAPDGERGGGAGAPASFASARAPSHRTRGTPTATPPPSSTPRSRRSRRSTSGRRRAGGRGGGGGGLASAGRAGNCRLEATSTSSAADDAGAAPLASSASSKEKKLGVGQVLRHLEHHRVHLLGIRIRVIIVLVGEREHARCTSAASAAQARWEAAPRSGSPANMPTARRRSPLVERRHIDHWQPPATQKKKKKKNPGVNLEVRRKHASQLRPIANGVCWHPRRTRSRSAPPRRPRRTAPRRRGCRARRCRRRSSRRAAIRTSTWRASRGCRSSTSRASCSTAASLSRGSRGSRRSSAPFDRARIGTHTRHGITPGPAVLGREDQPGPRRRVLAVQRQLQPGAAVHLRRPRPRRARRRRSSA